MLRLSAVVVSLLVCGMSSWTTLAAAADKQAPPTTTPEQAKFFTEHVQPILKSRCWSCHSHAAKKDSGSLMLDSRGALVTGGDSGSALDEAKPDESLLLVAVRYVEDYPRMPPKGKLPEEEIKILVDWVKQGAPWPGDAGATPIVAREKITAEDRAYWAFQALKETAPPNVADPAWNANPIDRFLRARLDAEQLAPSPPAEPADLIRRVYFDLTGLPPTPEEVAEFIRDASPQAYAALVDKLLASPRYGERWARHWLDLVRYAESDGYRIDDYRDEAWRYRDYVVQALNDDKPYDQFVREQLAGDEIAPDDPAAQTAVGFLRHGIYEYNSRDVRTQWTVMLDDVTDVVSDVFLGLGMGCAKCHDHKFDPILQKDYFRLQAFLAPMQPHDDLPTATKADQAKHQLQQAAWEKKAAKVLADLEKLEAPARASAERAAINKFPEDIRAMLEKPYAERTPFEKQLAALAYRQVTYEFDRLDRKFKDEKKEQLVALRKKLSELTDGRPAPLPHAMTVRDVGREAPEVRIPKKAGDPIPPEFLEVLGEPAPQIVPPPGLDSTGRRTALANWLTKPDHPLTTRVIVNRVWQYHFGRGLVPTASDFGRLGEKPSHPELLDWLAIEFVREGWSLKKLHRLMVTSQAYRQNSGQLPVAGGQLKEKSPNGLAAGLASRSGTAKDPLLVDPENRLLWRMPNRRLDAEQVRDALLAVTGKLDLEAGGPAVGFSESRRSIYCRVTRNTRDPLLDVFDAPEGFQSAASRNVTTTPTQALLLMNSPLLLDQARSFADRLRKLYPDEAKSSDVDADRIAAAFRLAFGREPSASEQSAAVKFLQDQARRIGPEEAPPEIAKLDKIPYRDGHAVVMDPSGAMRRIEIDDDAKLPNGDFTIEAFVLLRSTYETASVRTIAAHWNGDNSKPGWSLGVTSQRSQFKPQMLVLQLAGTDANGKPAYEPIFSSLAIQLNKPYYVAVSVRMSETGANGVTFYAKDLSNDDEPLLTSTNAHKITTIPRDRGRFTLGSRGGEKIGGIWDGLIDDVRLSSTALDVGQLLLTNEAVGPTTVGFWEFEPAAGLFRDSSPNRLDLKLPGTSTKSTGDSTDHRRRALIDFCHVLLNANEFLYVD